MAPSGPRRSVRVMASFRGGAGRGYCRGQVVQPRTRELPLPQSRPAAISSALIAAKSEGETTSSSRPATQDGEGDGMLARSVLNHILEDDALTRHLGDAEARVLVEWLVEEAEALGDTSPDEALIEVQRLRRRGRALSRFVRLWSLEDDRRGATQLAASEGFGWPLPDGPIDACLLMQYVVWYESQRRQAS